VDLPSAFGLGTMVGLTKVPPPKARRTVRLLVNNYLNNIGKTSSQFANSTAACVFLYLMLGRSMTFMFIEEFERFHVGEIHRAAIAGAITGGIYKSTRGVRPMLFASLLGTVVGSVFTYSWSAGYTKLNIKF
jgi:hypothetical protein